MVGLHAEQFDYPLPEELIAQEPAPRRDDSRLMVVPPGAGSVGIRHRRFRELPQWLRPGDCLVINDSRVVPARLAARRAGGAGGAVEILLVERLDGGEVPQHQRWRAMVRPGRRVRPGDTLVLAEDLTCRVLDRDDRGGRVLSFEGPHVEQRLRQLGRLPLPPYIRRQPPDPERYQTVFARHEGSIAAPTAGLHFTPDLLDTLRAQGVTVARITLHVGPGTFRPVRTRRVEDHVLDPEPYEVPEDTAEAVAAARRRGGRVVAVGTTVTRTLESVALPDGTIRPGRGRTGLFILPGHRFRVVDALLTNLHLPRSTLLMLVAAFCGPDRIRAAYREAVRCRYRFFSFGDAMLLLGGRRDGHPVHPA